MRIGMDAYLLNYEGRGMGKYILRLVQGLAKTSGEEQYVVYGPRDAFPELRDLSNFTLRDARSWPYPVWEQWVLPSWASKDRLDLLHCPSNTAPLKLDKRIKRVVTIHDLMYMLPASVIPPVKTLRQRLGKIYRRSIVPRIAGSADTILTVSEFSKRNIMELLSTDASRIRVVYEGVDQDLDRTGDLMHLAPWLPKWEPRTGFIMALGAHDPRKNTEMVIQVYAHLRRGHGISEKLAVVGLPGWRSSWFYRLARQLEVTDDVFFAGFVPDEALFWFYRSARCFLYPSLYKGFGYPPLEAMACCTPVVTSNVASIPEVVGDAALLVEPTCPESIRDALLRVLRDESLRKTLIEQGPEQAAKFRWQTTVEQTLQVYQEVLESSGRFS